MSVNVNFNIGNANLSEEEMERIKKILAFATDERIRVEQVKTQIAIVDEATLEAELIRRKTELLSELRKLGDSLFKEYGSTPLWLTDAIRIVVEGSNTTNK